MDKIVEEVLTNMIRRIEVLEEKVNGKYQSNQQKQGYSSGVATEGQLKYLKVLGGDTWEGMTKAEAGKEIDRMIKIKEAEKDPQEAPEGTPEGVHIDPEIKRMAEGKLTPEEIEEIGEENLL